MHKNLESVNPFNYKDISIPFVDDDKIALKCISKFFDNNGF
jgi:hypothetical protein